MLHKRICFKDSEGIHINKSHQYFYQIQQALFVTTRMWVDFVVKGSTYEEIYIERVLLESTWWLEVKQKLEHFFDAHICPELAFPMIKYGLPRVELLTRSS